MAASLKFFCMHKLASLTSFNFYQLKNEASKAKYIQKNLKLTAIFLIESVTLSIPKLKLGYQCWPPQTFFWLVTHLSFPTKTLQSYDLTKLFFWVAFGNKNRGTEEDIIARIRNSNANA